MINKLSRYIKKQGKTYKDHYIAILNKDKTEQNNTSKQFPNNYEDSEDI